MTGSCVLSVIESCVRINDQKSHPLNERIFRNFTIGTKIEIFEMDEIVNRIAKSPLVTIDLEDFYPEGRRMVFDLKDFLYEELILREKDFREQLKNHDWTQYQDAFVAMDCSTDAIIPSWAFLLVATYLQPYAKKIIKGNLIDLETSLYQEIISNMDVSSYEGKKIIIKGCSKKPVPDAAYIQLIEKIQPHIQSLMFGEACSTVPLLKKKSS